jgi:copper chaperone CopZ
MLNAKLIKTYKIKGLDCASCASLVEMDLEEKGIRCKCSYAKESLEVEGEHDFEMLKEIIEKSGYNINISE